MNRSTLFLATASLALALTGCGSGDDQAESGSDTAAADAKESLSSMAGEAEQALDAATRNATQAANDAADAIGEGYDQAATQARDTANEAAAAADQLVRDAQESAQEAAQQVSETADQVAQDARETMDEATAAARDAMPAGAAVPGDDGDPCTLSVEVGDNIAYSTDSMTVPASCADVTVTITHTGNLPAVAMGHNWVLVPADALDAIATAGMSAGPEANYVPDDDRIVAATGVVGGGESDSVTFALADLADGVSYRYVCTFPGHSAVMRGSFNVSG